MSLVSLPLKPRLGAKCMHEHRDILCRPHMCNQTSTTQHTRWTGLAEWMHASAVCVVCQYIKMCELQLARLWDMQLLCFSSSSDMSYDSSRELRQLSTISGKVRGTCLVPVTITHSGVVTCVPNTTIHNLGWSDSTIVSTGTSHDVQTGDLIHCN